MKLQDITKAFDWEIIAGKVRLYRKIVSIVLILV